MKTNKSITKGILQGKCPRCGEGDIFQHKHYLLEWPKMNDHCEKCHYDFWGEPGYFLGAMYVSYALAVGEGLLTFLLCYFLFPSLETIFQVLTVIGVITLFSMRNFKFSRIIYMYIFPCS